ncbi:MAG: HNH endonuclease [Nitrospiraceae bacterium]
MPDPFLQRRQLRAAFFVTPDGTVISKARPLHGAERRKIYERDGKHCVECSTPVKLFRRQVSFLSKYSVAHVDHILPRARGGQNHDSNLRLLCERCNESRGAAL